LIAEEAAPKSVTIRPTKFKPEGKDQISKEGPRRRRRQAASGSTPPSGGGLFHFITTGRDAEREGGAMMQEGFGTKKRKRKNVGVLSETVKDYVR